MVDSRLVELDTFYSIEDIEISQGTFDGIPVNIKRGTTTTGNDLITAEKETIDTITTLTPSDEITSMGEWGLDFETKLKYAVHRPARRLKYNDQPENALVVPTAEGVSYIKDNEMLFPPNGLSAPVDLYLAGVASHLQWCVGLYKAGDIVLRDQAPRDLFWKVDSKTGSLIITRIDFGGVASGEGLRLHEEWLTIMGRPMLMKKDLLKESMLRSIAALLGPLSPTLDSIVGSPSLTILLEDNLDSEPINREHDILMQKSLKEARVELGDLFPGKTPLIDLFSRPIPHNPIELYEKFCAILKRL